MSRKNKNENKAILQARNSLVIYRFEQEQKKVKLRQFTNNFKSGNKLSKTRRGSRSRVVTVGNTESSQLCIAHN
jgi:hypothetical protein